ncbi:serine/threonine-protein kinase [Streptomyces longispororuber]|uniref:serine/threonine-protein kinase n=1 Tax=Streptomyces longispororuber TaxID=68230 RepID=UPI0036FC993A
MSTDGGRVIGGRYRLVERIGSGGMGTVWRAVDELVGREVAVKEPRLPGDPRDEAGRRAYARIRREARAAARVEHPAAVAIHDVVVEDDEQPWIVMELVRGESLHEVLKRGALAPAEAARVGLALVGALAAAHAKGIVHRDVKPANVLLGDHGRVVLTDFGIARIQGEEALTVSGEFVGSLEFVAPERMASPGAGPASDLWSLGVLLYAAVEGSSPFRRPTLESTLAAVLSAEVPRPARAGELAPLIERLLAREPERRPSAPEVAAALSAVAAVTGRDRVDAAGPEPGTTSASTSAAGDAAAARPGDRTSARAGDSAAARPESDTAPVPGEATAAQSRDEPGGTAATRSQDRAPLHRRVQPLVTAALVGALLVGGGVWLGTSVGGDGGDGGEAEAVEAGGWSSGGDIEEGEPAPPGYPEPDPPASPSAGARWKVHKEARLAAEVAVPVSYTEVVRDRENPLVEYSEPDGRVSLRLTKPAGAPAANAVAWANKEMKSYESPAYLEANTTSAQTRFRGQDAALLDATYKEDDGDPDQAAAIREMRLLILTDAGEAYELMVRMPKGVAVFEKQGTALFKAARDRLKVGKAAVGSGQRP